jgi:hypothetical protein
MRQVFTSPRLENVEAVAELLRAQGIEVRITEGRSYRGNRRSSFSYREREDAGPQPAVWILRAEDQPRGRQLLRDAGLLESSRGEGSYLPLSSVHDAGDGDAAKAKARRTMRIKLGLLALIAVVVALAVFTARTPDTTTQVVSRPPPSAPALVPQPIEVLDTYRADVPTALARLMLEQAVAAAKPPASACIAVDGRDPAPTLLAPVPATDTVLLPASACTRSDARRIDISEYLTDGSGTGSVRVAIDDAPAQVFDVERDGTRWRILRTR